MSAPECLPGARLLAIIYGETCSLHAHLRQEVNPMADRLRTVVLTVFCAYIGFVLAGLALYGLVDDSRFIPAMNSHLDIALAWYVIAGGSAIALAAAVIGGLPIGYAIIRRALQARRRDILFLLAVPLISLAVLGTYVLAVALITTRFFSVSLSEVAVPPTPGAPVLVSFALLFILAAIASTTAVCVAVSRSDADEQTFRARGITITVQPYEFALLPAAVTTLAMLLMLVGTLTWGLLARAEVPETLEDNTMLVIATTNGTAWLAIVALMGFTTLVAAGALLRVFASSRRASPPAR